MNVAAEAPDHEALKRASVQGVALTFGSQGVRFVLQFIAQIVLAHWLLPAQFGLVAMVAPVLSLVQVFNDLGLTQATVQRPNITQGELSALFWINLGVSLVLAGVLALAAPLVAWFYGQPNLLWITISCGSLLILSGGAAQQIALMNRHMRFAALATIDVACAAAAFVTGLVAAIAGCGAWSLILMQAANSFTIFALAWALSDWRPHWPRRQAGIGSLLRFGGHLTGFNLLNYLQVNLSTILIGRFDGTASLGLYDRAYKLVIVPWWQISLPIDRVAVSLLSRLQGSDQSYRRAHLLMLQGLLMVAAPGLLWAATQSTLLVPMVLGPNWQGASAIVGDLSLATILVPFGAAAYWLFVSQGRVQTQLHYGLASGLVLIASILAGLHWGPLGVARSYALFTPLIILLPLWGATRTGPVRLPDVARAIGPIAAGLLVASAALLALPAARALHLAADLVLAYAACGATMLCLPAGRHILTGLWALKSDLLGPHTRH
jgi:PST family polysaccharide transporter